MDQPEVANDESTNSSSKLRLSATASSRGDVGSAKSNPDPVAEGDNGGKQESGASQHLEDPYQRRKRLHRLVEKKRRIRVKERMSTLQSLLQSCSGEVADVLEAAVDRVNSLQRQVRALKTMEELAAPQQQQWQQSERPLGLSQNPGFKHDSPSYLSPWTRHHNNASTGYTTPSVSLLNSPSISDDPSLAHVADEMKGHSHPRLQQENGPNGSLPPPMATQAPTLPLPTAGYSAPIVPPQKPLGAQTFSANLLWRAQNNMLLQNTHTLASVPPFVLALIDPNVLAECLLVEARQRAAPHALRSRQTLLEPAGGNNYSQRRDYSNTFK